MRDCLELGPYFFGRCVARGGRRPRILAWALLVLSGVGFADRPACCQLGPSSAVQSSAVAISGRVLTDRGQPLAGATVSIYSAKVRVGSSPLCPTCYGDCGKSTVCDAEGAFGIKSVDPSLQFRLLAMAPGFAPRFIEGVDPILAPRAEVALHALTLGDDQQSISGEIVTSSGGPAVGAVAHVVGTRQARGQKPPHFSSASASNTNTFAVADKDGKFSIPAGKSIEVVSLRVEHRGSATRIFELGKPLAGEHRLRLSAGSIVSGRVVRNNQPIKGVELGIVQRDRGVDRFIGDYKIGTNADGRFHFSNLPEHQEMVVYGIMGTLKRYGGLVPQLVKTGAEQSVVDLGDLSVGPAFHVDGRIALPPNSLVPPETRLLVSRVHAWDRLLVPVDDQGRFSADGIPGEPVSLSVMIPGYRPSPVNKSLDPNGKQSLKGLVSHDISGLIIRLEPAGETEPAVKDWLDVLKKSESLERQPLAGAE